ncbi:hypothetical protein ACGFX4_35275 [Kitasatospora sp. NPDC048365]|uniref:hypothetical protein n=1 Tax=Kitasatospora sp. NPDC048365 TaxID=3364050 RepID=UPI003723607C
MKPAMRPFERHSRLLEDARRAQAAFPPGYKVEISGEVVVLRAAPLPAVVKMRNPDLTYLIVDPRDRQVTLMTGLDGDRYHTRTTVDFGAAIAVPAPFDILLDTSRLIPYAD